MKVISLPTINFQGRLLLVLGSVILKLSKIVMAIQPTPPNVPPPRNKGLIAGLIKRNQRVFISPDHKAGYFWGGGVRGPEGLVDQSWYLC